MITTLFYFTGTGNSLKVAKDISANLENCNLISMAVNIDKVSDFTLQDTVGFVFPVYYCGIPQLVREFISLINLNDASYIFIACTYGSIGGNAGCISQTTKILKERGKTLNAGFYVKTVDNFIIWTWDIPSAAKHSSLHENAYKKAKYISQIIAARKNHCDRSITECIGPIIFRYNHFIKTVNSNDKAFYSTDRCTSCGLCTEVCPTNNIDIKDKHPVWKNKTCQRCLACLHLCPCACIQYGKITIKKHRYKNPHITINEFKRSKKL